MMGGASLTGAGMLALGGGTPVLAAGASSCQMVEFQAAKGLLEFENPLLFPCMAEAGKIVDCVHATRCVACVSIKAVWYQKKERFYHR